jgi:hypothetical protein
MGIKRSSARAKGAAGEVEILFMLQQIMAEEYIRLGLPPPELYRGANGRDIRGIRWLAPEVKRHEPLKGFVDITIQQIEQWWEQAKVQASAGQLPALFYRPNRQPWRVRVFGHILIDEDNARAGRIRAPVDISLEVFKVWFRERVKASLANSGGRSS